MPSPAIISFEGKFLSIDEKNLFNEIDPIGFILFERNIEDKNQIKELIDTLNKLGQFQNKLILVDQEGGKVSRLNKPYWREIQSQSFFGRIFDYDPFYGIQLLKLNTMLVSYDLISIGFNVNCSPVVDLYFPNSHDIIGNRAFHSDPHNVSKLAKIYCETLIDGGVLPVLKHIPGHGRGDKDSHLNLPIINSSLEELKKSDFYPFSSLSKLPIAMTAHVLFTKLDKNYPVTVSDTIIQNIIRDTIGFKGLLITDDISNNMRAINDSEENRAIKALNAGCDIVLHCSGNIESTERVITNLPEISKNSLTRVMNSLKYIKKPKKINYSDTMTKYEDMLEFVSKKFQ